MFGFRAKDGDAAHIVEYNAVGQWAGYVMPWAGGGFLLHIGGRACHVRLGFALAVQCWGSFGEKLRVRSPSVSR